MARPKRHRRICCEPKFNHFAPAGMASKGNSVFLELDEYEVFRLMDYEGLTQKQCALQMQIARTTVAEIYDSARKKLADMLVNGKNLRICGGIYKFCDGTGKLLCQKKCCKNDFSDDSPTKNVKYNADKCCDDCEKRQSCKNFIQSAGTGGKI